VPVGGKIGVFRWGYIVGKPHALRCLSGPRLTYFEGRDKGIHAEEDSINPLELSHRNPFIFFSKFTCTPNIQRADVSRTLAETINAVTANATSLDWLKSARMDSVFTTVCDATFVHISAHARHFEQKSKAPTTSSRVEDGRTSPSLRASRLATTSYLQSSTHSTKLVQMAVALSTSCLARSSTSPRVARGPDQAMSSSLVSFRHSSEVLRAGTS
jgi:hypothetical protein